MPVRPVAPERPVPILFERPFEDWNVDFLKLQINRVQRSIKPERVHFRAPTTTRDTSLVFETLEPLFLEIYGNDVPAFHVYADFRRSPLVNVEFDLPQLVGA